MGRFYDSMLKNCKSVGLLNPKRILLGISLILMFEIGTLDKVFAESKIERARAVVGQYIRAGEFEKADKLLIKLIAVGDAPSNYLRALLIVKKRLGGTQDEIKRHLCVASEQGYSRANTLLEKLDVRCDVLADDKTETDPKPRNENQITVKQPEIATKWLKAAPKAGYGIYSGGSGVAINANGMFITNHHVIDGCSLPTVVYQQLRGKAKVLMASEPLDMALLQVDAPTPNFAKFDQADYALGEALYAAGYPLSPSLGDDLKFSQGILMSARDDERGLISNGFLVTDLTIGNGSSGGPVLSEDGLLRGLVSRVWIIGEALEGLENSRMSENLTGVVSGLEILKQLRSFDKQIPQVYEGARQPLRSREIARLAETVTVKIECITYD